ncbi:MAG: hypothetical protein DHS20C15_25050 [Planctomycetota bacterium]|nr:MAG: hypothetical protein DHS20C15_25050 [Planctomycetota bacterium]
MNPARKPASRHLGRKRPSQLGSAPWGEALCWALMLHLGVATWWGAEFSEQRAPRAESVRAAPQRPLPTLRFEHSVPERVDASSRDAGASAHAARLPQPETLPPVEPAPQVQEPQPVEPALQEVDAQAAAAAASVPQPAVARAPRWDELPSRARPQDVAAGASESPAPAPAETLASEEALAAETLAATEPPASPPTAPPAESHSEPRALAENRPPRYPGLALRRGWEGRVLLEVSVTSAGHAGEVRVLESSGVPLLDATARKAVSSWRFEPARRAGRVSAGSTTVALRFQLAERSVEASAGS